MQNRILILFHVQNYNPDFVSDPSWLCKYAVCR